MPDNGRRIRSLSKPDYARELKRDPVRRLELGLIAFGTLVSALSSLFAWQAASSSAEQARYAREALTTTDLNRTFEGFLDNWTKLCDTIDITDGTVGFELRAAQDHQIIIVEATDLAYEFRPLDRPSQRRHVIKAMDSAVAAQEKLGLWLSHDTIETMGFEVVMANLIMLSRIDASESEGRHYSAMLKQAGYCKLWKRWFMTWFKEGYLPTPNIPYKDVRLVFHGRGGSNLNDQYIKESRELPWDEINQFAPP